MNRTPYLGIILVLTVIFSISCTNKGYSGGHEGGEQMNGDMMAPTSKTKAASLRKDLNLLLAEHVWLAGAATNAALNGNQEEFEAAAASLDENSKAIAAANSSVYGEEAGEAFLPLWRKHIGFIVDYTKGLASGNKQMQNEAVNNLMEYTKDFGAFLHSASPSLPADAVAGLVKEHVITFKSVVDAQAAGKESKAFTNLRKAVAHMQNIADAHAEAIVKQFPDKFDG